MLRGFWPGLIKEKHFDFTWQEKPIPSPALQKGEVHEACPITKSMWPEMERKEREWDKNIELERDREKAVRYKQKEHERLK